MIRMILLVSISSIAFTSNAYVYGGSNLNFSGYPDFSELTPSAPYGNDQYMWNNYKFEVENYVRKAKEYVENGDNDIKRIKEAQQKTINDANQVVEEYNRKVRGY
ncbi:hypothetical protein [Pectobacterium carotovorum]|uniref:hypothetical protein n=1 Tax=Pectobacterium carotovorum TaxID=554 RepID=UPI001373C678|nr:hypothetical protein [Pectobacterium carotovorum]QHP59276.1 hypothetical protein EH204_15685 [Pectobacterium carotovorum subsp. carotovorum]WDF97841.1 hypothetical protein PSR30_15675 [Pectobacterium carotovorum subsp. carotovorum]